MSKNNNILEEQFREFVNNKKIAIGHINRISYVPKVSKLGSSSIEVTHKFETQDTICVIKLPNGKYAIGVAVQSITEGHYNRKEGNIRAFMDALAHISEPIQGSNFKKNALYALASVTAEKANSFEFEKNYENILESLHNRSKFLTPHAPRSYRKT